jgi:hypothetical protein
LALGHANKLSYVSPTNQSATTPEKRHGQRSNAKQQGKEEAEAGQEKVKGRHRPRAVPWHAQPVKPRHEPFRLPHHTSASCLPGGDGLERESLFSKSALRRMPMSASQCP